MNNDFNREKPIYAQLVERICSDIIKNRLAPGMKMLSVREYALEVGVNVNTVQRVYKELEQMRLTETKRGQGTFITTDEARIQLLRQETRRRIVEQFFHNMNEFGFTKEEVLAEIKRLGADTHD
ncbi:MAG: GntR family transcriptional regulator [Kurthia gibsonii]|uniref:GntR family transcriptional regulator n=1 Tax=Kurthia gibsonii TaxID=33946 RepID=A0ABU9LLB0_9BACL|nr:MULTISPECIES: GntR family transcriptional regulator [Kurthia]MCA9724439.1 GntR family transcriptional regulator [Kurthia sp.]AMA62866.1 bacterial regulatory s, gntR family protein [Kurthia sp. 11kri321]MEB6112076.1 GntR family transcriptional regulator [Kurthia gibsonii]RXH53358.1 GntR family transcriptional regulator [Kurthia gibsonii]WIL37358.1 GntR family transcriptional regulator [Kurthia sp. YJT4]